MSLFEYLELKKTVRYPWRDMKIGQEFIFPPSIKLTNARIMARAAGVRWEAKFKVYRVGNRLHCKRVDGIYSRARRGGYPWRTMKVGETFEFRSNNMLTCRSYACKMGVELGRKFKVEEGKQVIRCRRTK